MKIFSLSPGSAPTKTLPRLRFSITVFTPEGIPIGTCFGTEQPGLRHGEEREFEISVPRPRLAHGRYCCGVSVGKGDHRVGMVDFDTVLDTLAFEVRREEGDGGTLAEWPRGWGSVILPDLKCRRWLRYRTPWQTMLKCFPHNLWQTINHWPLLFRLTNPHFCAKFWHPSRTIACLKFQVYVGDDASPENIRDIVREFSDKLPIHYHRFSKNLGAFSLAEHWRRCINLSHESWVWLFSDDDLMEKQCVETFYRELRSTSGQYEFYRFNTCSINGQGRLISENAPHPQNESGPDFLVSRLRGGRTSTAQELIFSRTAWESIGGFPDFPLGWASDDAFIATLGSRKPIRVIPGPRPEMAAQWKKYLNGQFDRHGYTKASGLPQIRGMGRGLFKATLTN